MTTTWQRIVEAGYQGGGWWRVVFDCGHAAKVLHGTTSPLGESAKCWYCDRKRDLEAL